MSLVGGTRGGFEFVRVDILADKVGASEVGVRFLLGLLSGFPFAILYLLFFSKSCSKNKHLFFTLTGLAVNYFCFGADCAYNLFSIFIAYCSIVVNGGTTANVLFAFIFQTTYLTAGYIMNASDKYDLKWTTPQCILCLRLIGLSWDVYDGKKNEESLSADQKALRVEKTPSLMEIFGFAFCFCGFLTGPQFSFRRYLEFVDDTLYPKDFNQKSSRYLECLRRLFGAIFITACYSQLDSLFQSEDLLKPSFMKESFLKKVLQMGFIYYVQFSKYVFSWWFSESICILLGISYNGLDKSGNAQWDGLNNFKLRQFLFGPFFQDIIESFNINTNQWAGRYLFRRLRFLGNRSLSHIVTLFYLSLWHGFYVGYFIMFGMEFIQMIAERQYRDAFSKYFNTTLNELPLVARVVLQMFGAVYKFLVCGFYVQSFIILRWRRIKIVYASVYYWPLIIHGLWFFVLSPLMFVLNKSKPKKNHDEDGGKRLKVE